MISIKLRLIEIHRVLKNTGSFYCHCDPNAAFEIKTLCDSIFSRKYFRREVIWNVGSVSGFKSQVKGWVRQHDTILYYTKSETYTFNKQFTPYKEEYIKKMFRFKDESGRLYRKRRGGKQYLDDKPGNVIQWADRWYNKNLKIPVLWQPPEKKMSVDDDRIFNCGNVDELIYVVDELSSVIKGKTCI